MPSLARLGRALGHVSRAPEVMRCVSGVVEWPTAVSGYIGLRSLTLPFTLRFRNGLKFEIHEFYDLETIWQIWFREIYKIRPTDRVIVDAGANVGFFSSYAATQNPACRVWAVEPFPSTFDRLVQNLADNGFAARVSCHNLALAKERGTRLMSTTAEESQSQWMQRPDEARPNSISVQAATLSDFMSEAKLDRVDLLKMDIEGSEFEVLLNADPQLLRRFQRIELEYHEPPDPANSKKELFGRLQDAGFKRTFDTGEAEKFGVAYFEQRT